MSDFCVPQKATRSDGFGILWVYIDPELKIFERGPMALRQRVSCIFFVFAVLLFVCAAAPLPAQVPRPSNFLAEHYDVSATLDPIGQSLSASAKVEFKAAEASSSVRVELHPNLVVKEVKAADGKQLSFERDNQNPLFLTVQLLSPVASGGQIGRAHV